jgi:hypothetical protein
MVALISRLGVVFALLPGFLVHPLAAKNQAVIVVGLTPDTATAESSRSQARETARLLQLRGIPEDNIALLGADPGSKANRETITQALAQARSLGPDQEFWLVLFGQCAVGDDGTPAYQVSGPRLRASDLNPLLDSIPARQSVLIATASSGGFLKPLLHPRRQVVTATADGREQDHPRFAELWVQAMTENPRAPFTAIANRTAALVDDYYQKSSLAQTEHARLADGPSGKILTPPFATTEAGPATAPTLRGPVPLLSASDIRIEIKDPQAEWEIQPPSPETRALIEAAKLAPNPLGYSALVLEQRLGYTVAPDRTTDTFTYRRIYLTSEEDPAPWTNYAFPQNPPSITTKLEVARIIQPDGSATVFNPAKIAAGSDSTSGLCGPVSSVFLPNARSGCVIEIAWRTRSLLDATLPELSETLPVQNTVPTLKSTVQIRLPNQPKYKAKFMNQSAGPETTIEKDWKTLTWTLAAIPAFESLPHDPPPARFSQWVAISSLASWDDFDAWFRRLAKDADVIDETVRQKARELAAGTPSQSEKIRKAYDFVSSLRYVAIEIGVQGFRPRTPATTLKNRYGDCKDKANLLAALLRSMDIDAHLALINRGSDTDVTFPSWQFNHAICYVPANSKGGRPQDLWLDSTDSVAPFGFVAPGNVGRPAFVIHPQKSSFKTVTPPDGNRTLITDAWSFTPGENASWNGTFLRTTTGMADYLQRAHHRSLTPLQRRFALETALHELLPGTHVRDAAFAHLADLSRPVEMSASFERAPHTHPGLPLWLLQAFAATERDRPLVINDGQPFSFRQTLRIPASHAPTVNSPKTPKSPTSDGSRFLYTWKDSDAGTRTRTLEIHLDQTSIAARHYGEIRTALINLDHLMRNSP